MKNQVCIVKNCGAKEGKVYVKWHQFLSNSVRREQWIEIIKNGPGFRHSRPLTDSSYVCGRHFTSNCYEGKTSRLKKTAVPDFFFPDLEDGTFSKFVNECTHTIT